MLTLRNTKSISIFPSLQYRLNGHYYVNHPAGVAKEHGCGIWCLFVEYLANNRQKRAPRARDRRERDAFYGTV